MDNTSIIEGNKLISEFMGRERRYESTFEIFWANLQYHSSWDWLHQVIEKIRQEYKVKDRTPKEITEFCHVTGLLICTPIEIVWGNVIIFIQWYNANKS